MRNSIFKNDQGVLGLASKYVEVAAATITGSNAATEVAVVTVRQDGTGDFSKIDDAVAQINASPWGLQAGVFTRDARTLFRLHAELDVGGVNGNDIPGYRVDHLPYGGAKASGLGREGVRYAIEEMTELRLLTIKVD